METNVANLRELPVRRDNRSRKVTYLQQKKIERLEKKIKYISLQFKLEVVFQV